MRVLIDACVLYPTVLREVVMGAAIAGLYTPLWSARIIEEWRRAAAKLGDEGAAVARVEAALLTARWPEAAVAPAPEVQAALHLPDPDDTHVLAAAIAGRADTLLTLNTRDFPTRTLAGHGISRRDPDGFLRELFDTAPDILRAVAEAVRAKAAAISGREQPLRPLLKKAGLPRLARALA